jgi:hypothetical protein
MRLIRGFLSMAIRQKNSQAARCLGDVAAKPKNRPPLQISTAPGAETDAAAAVNFAPESS